MVALRLDWQSPPSVIVGNLDAYKARVVQGLHALADLFSARIEGWMKANAPWNDRTSDARQSLTAIAQKSATGIVLTLAIGVLYGRYLEGGSYKMAPRPVLRPAMDAHVAAIAAALRALVA